jgi:hypothetical protein
MKQISGRLDNPAKATDKMESKPHYDIVDIGGNANQESTTAYQPMTVRPAETPELKLYTSDDVLRMYGSEVYAANATALKEATQTKELLLQTCPDGFPVPLDNNINAMGDEQGAAEVEQTQRVRTEEYLNTLPPNTRLFFQWYAAHEAHLQTIFAGLNNTTMSLGEQFAWQKNKNEQWVEGLRVNTTDLFKYHLYRNRENIEAGKTELAWLPSGFSMDDYNSYIDEEWVNRMIYGAVDLSDQLVKASDK